MNIHSNIGELPPDIKRLDLEPVEHNNPDHITPAVVGLTQNNPCATLEPSSPSSEIKPTREARSGLAKKITALSMAAALTTGCADRTVDAGEIDPKQISIVVNAHPDDEASTVSLFEFSPANHTVFATMTRGEETIHCLDLPGGKWGDTCGEVRMDSMHHVLKGLGEHNPTLPEGYTFAGEVSIPAPASGAKIERCDNPRTDIQTPCSGDTVVDRTADVYSGENATLIEFNLGDGWSKSAPEHGDLQPHEVEWALRAIIDNPGLFNLPNLPVYNILTPYFNPPNGVDTEHKVYDHTDHGAVHAGALAVREEVAGYVSLTTSPTNPQYQNLQMCHGEVSEHTWEQLFGPINPDGSHNETEGLYNAARGYGWLSSGGWNTSAFPHGHPGYDNNATFQRYQTFFIEPSEPLEIVNCDGGLGGGETIPAERFAGENRHDTAIQVSEERYDPGEAASVILARSDIFPDALAGGPLAAVEGGPLLLTPTDKLLESVKTEIDRLLDPGDEIHVLGGVTAISQAVENELKAAGYDITRYNGESRYDTAGLIADAILERVGVSAETILLASGVNFPDALAASAAGAQNEFPVLLTRDKKPAAETTAWLADNDPDKTYCVGGPACAAYPDSDKKLVGSNRYGTAVLVAEEFFNGGTPGVASGEDFPDALVGAADTPHRGGPLVLTRPDSLPHEVASLFESIDPDPSKIVIYGGPSAVAGFADQILKS